MISIRSASLKDEPAWDDYLDKHSDAPPYCYFAWRKAVEQAYGHKAHYLIAEDKGKICGVLPLFVFHIPFMGNTLVSLPYCDAGGVYGDSEEVCRRLIEAAYAKVEFGKAKNLEIRSVKTLESLEETSNNLNVSTNTDKVRMLLHLPANSEELWSNFKSKLRSQVRKAEKNGLMFRWGNERDIPAFYEVFSRNMHALGSPVHSRSWIEAVFTSYQDNARIGLVFKDEQPAGCGLILCTKKMVSIPWASTLREFNRLSPNMLLYWNFLKFAADSGRDVFDFGRSTPGEGTYRFKKQWGAEPQALYWYVLSTVPVGCASSGHGKKRVILENIWRRSPLSMVNVMGPLVRKYISL